MKEKKRGGANEFHIPIGPRPLVTRSARTEASGWMHIELDARDASAQQSRLSLLHLCRPDPESL